MRHLEKHSYIHKYFKKETDLGFLDFNRALSVCGFPDFPFSSYTTLWILYNFLLIFFVLFYLKAYYSEIYLIGLSLRAV